MAFLKRDLNNFMNKYSVGESVMITHSIVTDDNNTHKLKKEPCEIIGIYKHYILLRTMFRNNCQFNFSMTPYDFYNAVEPKHYILKNYGRDDLKLFENVDKPLCIMTGKSKKSFYAYEI